MFFSESLVDQPGTLSVLGGGQLRSEHQYHKKGGEKFIASEAAKCFAPGLLTAVNIIS